MTATVVLGLSASTAVALADDGVPGDPSGAGNGVATTVVDLTVTTIAPEPPTTAAAPTTTVTPPTTAGAPTTTEAPATTTTTEAPTTTEPPPVPTSIVRPGFSGCVGGNNGNGNGNGNGDDDDGDDDDGDDDKKEHRCRPAVVTPDPTTTSTTEAPTTTAAPTTLPPTSIAGGGASSPGPSDPNGDPGADGAVAEDTSAGSPDQAAVATGPSGTGGGDDDGPVAADDAPDDDEPAIAPFGETALAEGGLAAPAGSMAPLPPFSSRLWAALPLGLFIGLVLVGLALGAVRIARLGTTP